ncbi:MAG: peroxiredoxin [Simkaniaceae bacterium]|nr:peroxiredoxin [Simkaniaceae bacterium]
MIGKQAPKFETMAVTQEGFKDDFSLEQFRGKYVILFFYPLDFTFVCPTELHAFQERKEEFALRNAQVVGCSVDSHYAHAQWKMMSKKQGGIEGIEYPLIADLTKEIARDYGVLKEDEGVAYRGLFLIDKEGIIRHMLINDLPLGRSVDEALRTLDALIFFETHGEVCPANWHSGDKSMKPTKEGLTDYFGT